MTRAQSSMTHLRDATMLEITLEYSKQQCSAAHAVKFPVLPKK